MPVGNTHDHLVFAFPEVHRDAVLRIHFLRTLRIPDDSQTYHLPPGLGCFPLISSELILDDRWPEGTHEHGDVVMPMWQAEAMWMFFDSQTDYPFSVKIAAGKINVVTGQAWSDDFDHVDQNFVEVPTQPWLDGFCVEKGIIRQFVAMPLGGGYTVEEQLTGRSKTGGLQFQVRPLEAKTWERISRKRAAEMERTSGRLCEDAPSFLGLGAGGHMKQDIYEAEHGKEEWDDRTQSCSVSIVNSAQWQSLTGSLPPQQMPTASDYASAGLPWFDLYSEAAAIKGSTALQAVKSLKELGDIKSEVPLPENQSFDPNQVPTILLK